MLACTPTALTLCVVLSARCTRLAVVMFHTSGLQVAVSVSGGHTRRVRPFGRHQPGRTSFASLCGASSPMFRSPHPRRALLLLWTAIPWTSGAGLDCGSLPTARCPFEKTKQDIFDITILRATSATYHQNDFANTLVPTCTIGTRCRTGDSSSTPERAPPGQSLGLRQQHRHRLAFPRQKSVSTPRHATCRPLHLP